MAPYSSSKINGLARRSHSAAPASSSSSSLEEEAYPQPVRSKRSRPHSALTEASVSSSRKWDLDLWKRAKRPRQDHWMDSTPTQPSRPSRPLPSTSAAFNFFPHPTIRKRKSRTVSPAPSNVFTSQTLNAPSSQAARNPPPSAVELHSHAFGELRKSLAEGDESFVQRMRALESARATSSAPQTKHRRGRVPGSRTQSHLRTQSFHDDECEESDEDDILIVADGSSSPPSKKARSGVHTATSTPSDEAMDIDMDISPSRGTFPSSSSIYTTTPGLSTDSSLTSLTLSGPANIISRTSDSQSFADSPSTTGFTPWLPASAVLPAPPPVSREEKVVAALSLALANGADLNDYREVREAQEKLGGKAEADFHVGDLWH